MVSLVLLDESGNPAIQDDEWLQDLDPSPRVKQSTAMGRSRRSLDYEWLEHIEHSSVKRRKLVQEPERASPPAISSGMNFSPSRVDWPAPSIKCNPICFLSACWPEAPGHMLLSLQERLSQGMTLEGYLKQLAFLPSKPKERKVDPAFESAQHLEKQFNDQDGLKLANDQLKAKEIAAKEGKASKALKVIEDKVTKLTRHHSGLASFVSYFEDEPNPVPPPQEQERGPLVNQHDMSAITLSMKMFKNLSEVGTFRERGQASIVDLPDHVILHIMMRIRNERALARAIISSSIFLRLAFGPCQSCGAVKSQKPRFVAAVLDPVFEKELLLVRPVLPDRRVFTSAMTFLDRFIAVQSCAHPFFTLVASGGGYLVVVLDSDARVVQLWSPFQEVKVRALPYAPVAGTVGSLIGAVVSPTKQHFRVVFLFRGIGDDQISVLKFCGETECWDVLNISLPFTLSRSPRLGNLVCSSGILYMLDDMNERLLTFSLDCQYLGYVRLPKISGVRVDEIISRNVDGNACWIVLKKNDICVFELQKSTWTEKSTYKIPDHLYACKILGSSDDTAQIVLVSYNLASLFSLEDGKHVNLCDVPKLNKVCHCFCLPHPCVDHM